MPQVRVLGPSELRIRPNRITGKLLDANNSMRSSSGLHGTAAVSVLANAIGFYLVPLVCIAQISGVSIRWLQFDEGPLQRCSSSPALTTRPKALPASPRPLAEAD